MTPSALIVPTYGQMLRALSAWLAKAEEQGCVTEALMAARLAPDMFPLATQIRFACVQAQEGVYRLRGEAFPASLSELLDEGRNGGEHPGTIADARARIGETLALLEQVGSDMPDIDPGAPIAHALPQGMVFDLTAEQFVRDWALPQFYFHLMTAYAILRAQGVELGKVDYVAHMFRFLRPETI
ncbi:DUF1993 family protein [Sphingomonas sp. J315]|uniref:DUF1993 domain-containing protein n=1 Tax=Sphingomonas sp. J315 TaxID=2898433 RepID=UPI0021AD90FC|nr:DUF1993 domain-containing protein [Sphingomonas sp. J315]UUX99814.1 DUF1993 domain-containing protein [Sphingomonas sp. J315]